MTIVLVERFNGQFIGLGNARKKVEAIANIATDAIFTQINKSLAIRKDISGRRPKRGNMTAGHGLYPALTTSTFLFR